MTKEIIINHFYWKFSQLDWWKRCLALLKKFVCRIETGPNFFDKIRPKPSLARKANSDIQLWSTAPLHLQHSSFMDRRSHSAHVTVFPWKESTNHIPRKRVISPSLYIYAFCNFAAWHQITALKHAARCCRALYVVAICISKKRTSETYIPYLVSGRMFLTLRSDSSSPKLGA